MVTANSMSVYFPPARASYLLAGHLFFMRYTSKTFLYLKLLMEHTNEKVVFEGKRYLVYQWEQEMFDGTTQIFERVEHLPSVTVFAVYQNKLVIQKQIQPHMEKEVYCVPGGGVDAGEKNLDAAKRELLEEEGLESDDWEYWWQGGRSTSSYSWMNHIYIARNCQKVAESHEDAGERIEHLLFTPEEFFTLLDHSDFRHQDILPELLEIRGNEEKTHEFLTLLGIKEKTTPFTT